MSKNTNRVEAVERALIVLDAFKQGKLTLTLAELAACTGLYKSTILRLIGSLEQYGYITRTPQGSYHLGISIFQLGMRYKHTFDVEDIIRPCLRNLVASTHETAAYYIRVGDQRLCLYRENSPRSARHHLEEGSFLPLEFGATGHILRVFGGQANETEQDRQTHAQGHYISLGERDPDVAAVAVPILDKHGTAYGSLSVSGLRSRYTEEKRLFALKELVAEAQKLSESLQNRLPKT
ncbi:IclR family transcriptional regulator [Paracandidimonas soli]|uniref:IclR family transcriptional regulator n=1 Tax=Paracandidimonas soli TaxID=1917182 RepID=A0A4R3V8C4_9BURK|nr:IclR family transcriptional regulator [Paracandidimonas soli]TCV01407.1 IclR family transcriptional regulator [Paracandidimonas soli]